MPELAEVLVVTSGGWLLARALRWVLEQDEQAITRRLQTPRTVEEALARARLRVRL